MPQRDEVCLSLFRSVLVFTKSNVEYPVQTIFDAPMRPHSVSERFSVGQTGKKVTVMHGNFFSNLPCTPDPRHPCKVTPDRNIL